MSDRVSLRGMLRLIRVDTLRTMLVLLNRFSNQTTLANQRVVNVVIEILKRVQR